MSPGHRCCSPVHAVEQKVPPSCLPKTSAPPAVQAATVRAPRGKASGEGARRTQSPRGGTVQLPRPPVYLLPRPHPRLHMRGMNKGGQLGPTDGKANAATEDAREQAGLGPCSGGCTALSSAPPQAFIHVGNWGYAPRNPLQFLGKGGCDQESASCSQLTWHQIPALPLISLTEWRNLSERSSPVERGVASALARP